MRGQRLSSWEQAGKSTQKLRKDANPEAKCALCLVASLLLVAMPFAPCIVASLLLVAMPGAPKASYHPMPDQVVQDE